MSFSAGVFSINSAGQPVVTGTTISSSTFNAFTADIGTGLSTCVLKDGTQTITANIPMSSFKLTGLAAGTVAGNSLRFDEIATQAQQETGTSVATLVSPGRQQYHPSALKAWARVENTAGTPTADTSYNVASLTDSGTGDTRLVYTVAMSAENQPVIATISQQTALLAIGLHAITTEARVIVGNTSLTLADGDFNVGIPGDQ